MTVRLNYLTDYTAIQQESLTKFVFTHGHIVSNVILSRGSQLATADSCFKAVIMSFVLRADMPTP